MRFKRTRERRRGLSLLEMLLVVTLASIVVCLTWYYVSTSGARDVRKRVCGAHAADIDAQAALWYRQKGSWPATDLHDIGADRRFFPQGLPQCPVDGRVYELHARSHRCVGHQHP